MATAAESFLHFAAWFARLSRPRALSEVDSTKYNHRPPSTQHLLRRVNYCVCLLPANRHVWNPSSQERVMNPKFGGESIECSGLSTVSQTVSK